MEVDANAESAIDGQSEIDQAVGGSEVAHLLHYAAQGEGLALCVLRVGRSVQSVGTEHRAELRLPGDVDGFAVPARAAAKFGGVDQAIDRQVHHAEDRLGAVEQRHHHAEPRNADSEIRGAVQRIDHPGEPGAAPFKAVFLGKQVVVGISRRQHAAQQAVGSQIDFGNNAAARILDPGALDLAKVIQ